MNTTRVLSVLLATALLARADVLPPAQDSSSLKGKLSAATGKATTLAVSATRKGYVLFALGNLPADVLAADIANARLRVYFPTAKKPGAIAIHTVEQAWDEKTAALEPGISVSPVALFPPETVVGKKFVEVDVTATVQAWRAGTALNFGFAFVASGITSVTLGAKEGSGSGYPCELDIEIERALPDGSIGAMQLAVGAAVANLTDGSVAIAKLASSTMTVTAGSGLSGGGSVGLGGSVTLSLASGLTLGGTTTVSGGLALPTTTSSSVGVITQGGGRLIHSFGSQNFFAGASAGNFTLTGAGNVGIGAPALAALTTGGSNTALGLFALNANTTGDTNTAIGSYAMVNNLAGSNNTALGFYTLVDNTGSNNIAIGKDAGSVLTTGSGNIVIGHVGVAGDANIIRIGTPGTQTDTYLTGVIHGDGSGLTNLPIRYVFAYQIGGVTVPAGEKFPFNIAGDSSGFSTTSGATFTIPATGAYDITFMFTQNNAAPNPTQVEVQINGTAPPPGMFQFIPPAPGPTDPRSGHLIAALTAGDVITIVNAGASALNFGGGANPNMATATLSIVQLK